MAREYKAFKISNKKRKPNRGPRFERQPVRESIPSVEHDVRNERITAQFVVYAEHTLYRVSPNTNTFCFSEDFRICKQLPQHNTSKQRGHISKIFYMFKDNPFSLSVMLRLREFLASVIAP